MSSSNRLILSLTVDRLSAAQVKRGRLVRVESIELEPGGWSENWEEGLFLLDQPLRQLLSRFPGRPGRRPVTLLYHSPTLSKQIYSFDATPSEAREAAATKLRETVGYSDPVESAVLRAGGHEGQQSSVLACSEREELLRAFYAWLNRCGLEAQAMTPTGAALISAASAAAASAKEGTAVFYIDADAIAMVYAAGGRLELVRPTDMGYRKFIEAYAQAFGSQEQSGEDESEGEERSKRLRTASATLFEHGIPINATEVGGVELRATVFPFIAPVLQRICIDIKQTLRFGLPNADQPSTLMVCGPGAGIPHLCRAIGQSVELHVCAEPGSEHFVLDEPFGRGTLERHLAEARKESVSFLPEIAREAGLRAGLNRALLSGAALAAIGLGAEFGFTVLEQQRLDQALSGDSPRLAGVNAFHQRCDRIVTVSSAAGDVAEVLDLTIGETPQWRQILVELGSIADESIRIDEIRGAVTPEGSVLDVSGVALEDERRTGAEGLETLVSHLEQLPSVASVALGATARTETNEGRVGTRFGLKVLFSSETSSLAGFIAATEPLRRELP